MPWSTPSPSRPVLIPVTILVPGGARIVPEIDFPDAGDADATAAGERLESGCPLASTRWLTGITMWIFGDMVDLGGEHRRVGVTAS